MLTRAPELPTIARYPLDVTKTRLAASKAGQYTGILDCMTSTVRGEGFLALFKGVRPALAAIIPASGVDLAVYNTLREAYCEKAEARYQTELEQRTMEILQAGEADSGLELPPSPLGHPPISFTLGFGAVRLALDLHYFFICSARCLLPFIAVPVPWLPIAFTTLTTTSSTLPPPHCSTGCGSLWGDCRLPAHADPDQAHSTGDARAPCHLHGGD
jgi:hypothetical protein